MAAPTYLDSYPLTERQKEVYLLIARHILRHGAPPTIREMMGALGFTSPNAMLAPLSALEKKGLIRWRSGRRAGPSRCVRLAGVSLRFEFDDTAAGRLAREIIEGTPPPAR